MVYLLVSFCFLVPFIPLTSLHISTRSEILLILTPLRIKIYAKYRFSGLYNIVLDYYFPTKPNKISTHLTPIFSPLPNRTPLEYRLTPSLGSRELGVRPLDRRHQEKKHYHLQTEIYERVLIKHTQIRKEVPVHESPVFSGTSNTIVPPCPLVGLRVST